MNKVVIGIDIGGSTTKIVGLRNGEIICPINVTATDAVTSTFGALGKFISNNNLSLSDVEKIMLTGVGASSINSRLYGIPTAKVDEFRSTGYGGQRLTGIQKAIIVSMGTGTAFINADGDEIHHMGGTGVGGGTLLGLSQLMLNVRDFEQIIALAESGDLSRIDLTVGDISKKKVSMLSEETTASNFGKIHELATKSDIALGIINMIFQSIGMQAVFACRSGGVKDIILTGNLTTIPQAESVFSIMNALFGLNFIIPEHGEFATAIGAASAYYRDKDNQNDLGE